MRDRRAGGWERGAVTPPFYHLMGYWTRRVWLEVLNYRKGFIEGRSPGIDTKVLNV